MIRLLAVTFLFMLISGGAVAAPFSVSYVGTMENPTPAGQFFPNIVNGETYKVTLVMDNGGSAVQSQTWVASDLVSVKWEFNDSRNVVFEQNIDTSDNNYYVDGNATTDATGALTAFFSDVTGGGSVFDEVGLPDFAPPAQWFLNEGNYVFVSDAYGPFPDIPRVNDAAGGVQMNIASWSNPVAVASEPAQGATSVAVPTLPSFLLVALGGLLALFGFSTIRASK